LPAVTIRGRPGHGVLVPQVPWHQEMVSPEPIIQMRLASSPRLGRGEQRHMNVLESHEQTNSVRDNKSGATPSLQVFELGGYTNRYDSHSVYPRVVR